MPQEIEGVQVRPGTEADLTALTELYNHYVRETAVTFDTVPFSPEQRRPWLHSHPEDGPHRLLVAWTGDRIAGYATSSAFRPKPAYASSVEVSVYLAPHAVGRGIGGALYTALFEALAGEPVHRAFAGVALPNEASVRLHERFGFRPVGEFTEAGWKFDRFWDVRWYEKPLGGAAGAPSRGPSSNDRP
ncbi:GNAT family N-acetyltransferase [Streptomyces sp. Isolate_45]|uniref:GNAT family N-acetyltransferase n=1 Tax=Streptomyces sp. Isolate_45 TaxID=2950111 RepID=UPI002481D07B|nr:GNAT family N-acetyltransferase [Streptomyces sp. Isolate_45]MDA5285338.1 GNAT family N-acetyltransferase [Streptomyces sp. Isolate_45]